METVESINTQLRDLYGIDTITSLPIWRVVWSEDQFEKRLTNHSDTGVILLTPEVRELPKYRQWIKNRYVLERLTVIPEINADDLPTSKLSYEPVWVFEGKNGMFLPPKLEPAQLVIDTLYAAIGKSKLNKYVDSEENTTEEGRQSRIDKLQKELFGNETDVGDALAHKQAVIVPNQMN